MIDLRKVFHTLWAKRKLFLKVWIATFVISCIWILPQPRFYTSEVKLAPEMSGDEMGGGRLASIASSFGINIDGGSIQDAIYPELYPELFESPEFIVGLYNVKVETKDGEISTDYYTYIKKHQKKNPLTWPFRWISSKVNSLFEKNDDVVKSKQGCGVNPFMMSRADFALMQKISGNLLCVINTKNSVISIKVTDQDPLVSATMADSVRTHLQDFIIRYRTSKACADIAHYQQMLDSAEIEYNIAVQNYNRFCDTHLGISRQSDLSRRTRLETEVARKQDFLNVMEAQLQSAKVKRQETTPAFTTLKSSIVPVRAAGPKRMMFVLFMLILATVVTSVVFLHKERLLTIPLHGE